MAPRSSNLAASCSTTRRRCATAAAAIVRLAAATPLVVVHGGGRAIDAELRARGNTPAFVDGLRITDEAALDAVVSVLAGRTNTALVAAIGAAGGRAVGLTGADGRIGLSSEAGDVHERHGQTVDLGLVGQPDGDRRVAARRSASRSATSRSSRASA